MSSCSIAYRTACCSRTRCATGFNQSAQVYARLVAIAIARLSPLRSRRRNAQRWPPPPPVPSACDAPARPPPACPPSSGRPELGAASLPTPADVVCPCHIAMHNMLTEVFASSTFHRVHDRSIDFAKHTTSCSALHGVIQVWLYVTSGDVAQSAPQMQLTRSLVSCTPPPAEPVVLGWLAAAAFGQRAALPDVPPTF